jgi:hypothetical protein
VAKRHGERRPLLKSPKTQILVFPVLCQANSRAQGNSCAHYCAGQEEEEDDSEDPVCAFRRHHEYAQSRYSVRNQWPEILRLIARTSQIIVTIISLYMWVWLVSTQRKTLIHVEGRARDPNTLELQLSALAKPLEATDTVLTCYEESSRI